MVNGEKYKFAFGKFLRFFFEKLLTNAQKRGIIIVVLHRKKKRTYDKEVKICIH